MSPTALPPLSPVEPPRVFGAPALHTDGELLAVAIASDGTLYSVEEPGELRAWNLNTRQLIRACPLDTAAMVWSFNWAARLLASASDEIVIWEISSGDRLSAWSTSSWISSLAFQPGTTTLASGHEDGVVRVWDWSTGKLKGELVAGDWPVSALAFSRDGSHLASASEDRLIHVWELATLERIGTLEGHKDRIPALAWHPNGRLLYSAGWDTTVRVWDASVCEPVILLNSHATQVHALAISGDGKLLASADSDMTIHLWDTDRHQTLTTLRQPTGEIRCLAFTPDDGRGNLAPSWLAWGTSDQVVHLWDTRQGPGGAGLLDSLQLRSRVAVGPRGARLYSLGSGTDLRIWDIASGKALVTLPDTPLLRDFALSADGQWLAVSRPETGPEDRTCLAIHRTSDGVRQAVCEGQAGPITALAFGADTGLLASGGFRSSDVWLWKVPSGEPALILPDAIDECSVETLAFLPGSRILAVGGIDWLATSGKDGQIAFWDIDARKVWRRLDGGTTAMSFDPAGKLFASAGLNRAIRVWDIHADRLVHTLRGHSDTVLAVVFSPDGQLLATAGDDRLLRLWDVATGEPVGAWEMSNAIKGLSFSPDGAWLFSANGNSSCYQIEVEQVLQSYA